MASYKELADLIFPDVKDKEYYEEKYPRRELPEGAMVLRVAPSPTGNVHIGTIYQALINKIAAKRSGGVFYARIEDTDQKREIEGGIKQIIDALNDFDVSPDEGMVSEEEWNGNYGPYKQSLRKEIYQSYAKFLLEQGKAYPCFCSQEELNEIRAKQEAAKIRPGYYGAWAKYRNLSVQDAIDKIKNGEPYIIRFKSQGREDKKIKHKDVIKGNIEFPENDLDIIIIKSDGLPTYHFAHAVDDHLMGTTLVTRSDEWVSSVPLHLQLFAVLGFTGNSTDISNGIKEVSHAVQTLHDDYLKDEKSHSDESLVNNIRKFRDEFEKTLRQSAIDNVIVLIDDLDRCTPDRIIDTLEAIKLFLSVKKTTFIIAVDQRIIEYAVKAKYKEKIRCRFLRHLICYISREQLYQVCQYPT